MKAKTRRICAAACALFFSFSTVAPVSAASPQATISSTATSTTISGLTATALVHKKVTKTENGHALGYFSPSVNISPAAQSRLYRSTTLPSSYDLRTQNKLTSIKDQGSENDCWAYAALGSLESFLMPNENDDFSEADMVSNAGFDTTAENGGNAFMATAYLARWSGPLNTGSSSGVRKHVQNVDWLPGRSGNTSSAIDTAIKEAVMSTGAVFAPIYMDESRYYNAAAHSYYDPQSNNADHAVDIVGWSDSYAASNFTTAAGGTPKDNGAFICRNSWGTGWGDGGYFYVSYDDMNIGQDECAVFDSADTPNKYSQNYQYDTLGCDGGTAFANAGTNWMANVFTAGSDDLLSAVGFYTLQPSTAYRVYVIPNFTGSLANGTLAASGTIDDAGYHTVNLSCKAALTQGHPFAVEVEFIGSDTAIPLEGPVAGYSSQATASAGQSFVSEDGSNWEDTTDIYNVDGFEAPENGNSNLNVCLKAFTAQSPKLTAGNLTANATYYGSIPLSGTASAYSGISQVTIAADSKILQTTAGSGSTSMDYAYTIPAGTLSAGPHTLTVTATDTNGETTQQSTPITIGSPLVDIDTPAGGSTVTGDLTVAGWSVASSGVASNTVDVDPGTSAQKQYTTTAGSRPDVQALIYPSGTYPNGLNSGYSVTIPAASLTAGAHTIRVTMKANDGTTQSESRTVIIGPPAYTTVDSPTDGSAETGSMTVCGWALNHSGISRVDAYLFSSNGSVTSLGSVPAASMTKRADVSNAFAQSGYQGLGTSGYALSYNTSAVPAGTYTLSVAGIGNDGGVQWATRTITIGPSPLTTIDVPADGASLNGTVSIAGWALNHSGISRMDAYLFGSGAPIFVGSTAGTPLSERKDVETVFANQGYTNIASSGYHISLQTANVPAGTYTLAVAGIGSDGSVQWATKAITIGPSPLTTIDTPTDGAHLNGTVSIAGWALNHSGVQRVDAYLFGQGAPVFVGSTAGTPLSERKDVEAVFANQGYANIASSGYHLSLQTANIPAGTYTLSVAGIGNDGDVKWATKTVTIG